MEERFIVSFTQCYFIAFGVIIGGSLIGSIGPFLTGEAPLSSMGRIAQSLKIWAIIAAVGGTFDAIENFQKGLLDESTLDMFKQIVLIISAMIGVKSCISIIQWATDEDISYCKSLPYITIKVINFLFSMHCPVESSQTSFCYTS